MCSYLFSNFEIKSYNSVNKSALLICSPISCSWINFFWNAFTIITFKLLNSHFFVLGFSHKKKKKKKKKKKILHPAICNTLNVIRTKILHVIRQLRQKFKVFWLKIGRHGILEALIPNLDLDFWNSDTQKSIFGQIWSEKLSFFLENWHKWYVEDVDSYSDIGYLHFQPEIHFWANFWQKI